MKYVLAVLVLGGVIIFHELGHFWLAKANHIRVNEFWVGFGPTIFSFQKGETKFALKVLPFGGACVMEGEDQDSDDERSFQKKSVWSRISVVAAGPLFNFLMAFLCSIFVMGALGYVKPVAAGVADGSPAQEAGLQKNDEIVKMNHKPIHFASEVSMYVMFHSDETIRVTYLRDGQKQTADVTPEYNKKAGRYMIGFQNAAVYTRSGPLKTLQYSAYNVKFWIQYTVGSLRMLFTGQASFQDMSGPVGIVKVMGDSYEASVQQGIFYGIISLLDFAILLSANLGVINLFPFPALDGGRLVFLFIEAVRKKKVKQEREALVNLIGIVCLFGLMGVIMISDVFKLF